MNPSALAAEVSSAESSSATWQAQDGDHVMVDTDASVIYLVHSDGTSLALDGLTGQHRNVCYIGRCYYAATPTGSWTVKEVEKKGRSTTFGNGRFLRLVSADGVGGDDGQGRTAYGVHSHAQFDLMHDDKVLKRGFDKEGKGYRSYGCILLSESDLDLVVSAFDANGGQLSIETGPGLTPPPVVTQVPSWFGLPW